MVVRNYRKVLEEASQLTEMEQARLVKELARRLIQSHNLLDLSQVKDAALYVEYLRKAESKHPSGHLKTPEEFLRELESWEG
jgi:uncharacterized short protein YbdD (DUF466 family)